MIDRLCLTILLVTGAVSPALGAALELARGERICLVGNALGERMQHHNYWETLLHQRFPQHELVVRNLCFPGDEPLNRLRSLNFGDPDSHLTHSKASAVLFFFGFNESFAGPDGLESFRGDLARLIEETKTKNYSGGGPPKIVFVSPIAFENTGDANLPDGREQNERLAMYTSAMQEVATAGSVGFVDLYTPTRKLFESSDDRLTLDGAHLNDAGYRALAPILNVALFDDDADAGADADGRSGLLTAEIDDKNFHWWHRYRAVNGYSIYGTRGQAGSDGTYRNRDVMERERGILDEMCANRDARIWAIAGGKAVPTQVDDSNTLPFINPKTNVGGDNDPNRKAGKLGSLDYLNAEQQQKKFKLAPGYQIELVASEEQFPELANPVALNFDNRGRLWVATMPSYPQWQPKTKLDDKLLILEDHDGDGRSDVCKVFAGGLHQPTGFELGRGGAYVAQQPDILFLQDSDGDDQSDVRIRRLVGFDSADSHHGLAAFEWGPGGGLYFQEGTFKQSQIESPYGLTRLGDAGVWRFDPRTAEFEAHVSLAFANPWGHVFDRWGQNFIADASPGFNYWAAPISGHVVHPDKHPGGSRTNHLDFGGSKSKKQIPTFIKKRIRPSSGCEIVSSRNFPTEAQGNFLLNNVIGERTVLQHTVSEEGSGFVGSEIEPLVSCEDGNFRPVDLQFGPDGGLYIVDWHNALIGHLQHNLREPHRDHSHGRIWRISYKDRSLVTPPKIAGEPIEALLELLNEPEDRTRYRVRRELADRDSRAVIAAVGGWIENLDATGAEREHLLLEALWLHQTHNVANEQLLGRLLESPDHRARAAATRVLSYWRGRVDDPLALLEQQVHDSHPRVRLEAVRACSFIPSPRSMEIALEAVNYEMDTYLDYTLDETIRVLEDALGHSGSVARTGDTDRGAHQHGDMPAHPPIVFLGKNPQIVRYQLDRLSNMELLALIQQDQNPELKPAYESALLRSDMSRQDRAAALDRLVAVSSSDAVSELMAAIARVDAGPQQSIVRQLSSLLLQQPSLSKHRPEFRQATRSDRPAVSATGFAALVTSGDKTTAWSLAHDSNSRRRSFLAAIPLISDERVRSSLRGEVVSCLEESHPTAVRRSAVEALAWVTEKPAENFHLVAGLVGSRRFRSAAVATLGKIPRQHRNADDARSIAETLVNHAEATPAAQRTTNDFLDAMQLADELLALLPIEESRRLRSRLRETVVRVVRINTVHEEMRYDTPHFAVEAGRPVQLVLRNEDLMPHNLVVTRAGAMREVAELAATLPPDRQYVPESGQVLFATGMVAPHDQHVLTFTAPEEPGEYPYVCTFPRHWMRMYGVMVVVKDLDAWLANPTKPADPLGQNREFVRSWSLDDLHDEIDAGLRGRTLEIGKRIFTEASCLQCHKVGSEGGTVGPELSDVFKRWKGDRAGVLREILDPSHKVDPKYALYNVVTDDGKVLSGIVTVQDRESVTIITNPEKPEPRVIRRDDIDEMIKTSTSLMPRGLLDRFTQDEIFELFAFLVSLQEDHTSLVPESGSTE